MQKLIIFSLFFYFSLGASSSFAMEEASVRLCKIALESNRTGDAVLYLQVYDGKAAGNWEQTPVVRQKFHLPNERRVTLEIELPDGLYAYRAYIDLNRNGQLDTGSSGRPREPFAVGVGNARRKPSIKFKDALIPLDETHHQVILTLKYPKDLVDVTSEPTTNSSSHPATNSVQE